MPPALLSQFLPALLAGLAAAGLSHALIALARRRLRSGFQDAANERSLHAGVVPKTGGLGLFGAVFLVLLVALGTRTVASGDSGHFPPLAWLWLACASFIFVVCVINDRSSRELSPVMRLSAYTLAAAVLCLQAFAVPGMSSKVPSMLAAPAWLWTAAAVLTVLAFTNLFNFMDGMDGLAGSMGLIGFVTLSLAGLMQGGPIAPQFALIGMAVAGACAGFLGWNWPRARVFMGDTGSTFLGFSAAALGWLGWLAGLWHWSLPFLAFFPFWFDASVTLLRRLLRGEAVWRAHREHFYQRAVLSLRQAPDAHLRVLRPALVLMLCSAAAALWVQADGHQDGGRALVAATMLLGLHGLAALFVEHRLRLARTLDAAHTPAHAPAGGAPSGAQTDTQARVPD